MSNTIRFSGMASGLDTESIVKSMMLTHQGKIDTQKQNRTLINWKKDAWKDMNNQLNTFYTKYVDKLRLSNTFIKNKITVSNPNALDIDKSSTIPQGSHTMEITQLATGAYMKNSAMTGQSIIDGNTNLQDLGITSETKIRLEKLDADGKPLASGGIIEFNVVPTDKLSDLNAKLQNEGLELNIVGGKIAIKENGSGAESVKMFVINKNPDPDASFEGDSELFQKLGFSSSTVEVKKDTTVESKDFGIINKDTKLALMGITSGTITLNNTTIDLSEPGIKTIGDLERKLKESNKDLNINFDETNKRFFISTKETGDAAKINISDNASGNLLRKLGLENDSLHSLNGTDAKYKYNGMEFTSQSNNITVNGIKMTLKDTTTTPVQIGASTDADETYTFVKEFIDEYNKLIEGINEKIGAKKSYSYKPLTDEQKKEMKEDDIKAWEKKVKDSMFSRDSQLTDIVSKMRDILGSTVEGGDIKALSQIGITTGSWKEQGKLVIDEKKFKEALEKNPDEVINLFTNQGTKGVENDPKKGIATKLYEEMTKLMKSTQNKSYGTFYNDKVLNEDLRRTDKLIAELEQKYIDLENSYYKKFTAMEKMMSKLNSQSDWLASQLGGM